MMAKILRLAVRAGFLAVLLFVCSGCQKSENDEHVFQTQEDALRKAQALQEVVTENMNKQKKAIQDSTDE